MFDAMKVRHSTEVYQITPNVFLQWLNEGKIYVLTLNSVNREDVDKFTEINMQIIGQWPVDEPVLTVQDVSHKDVIPTPYIQSTTQIVWKTVKARKLYGENVLVVTRSPLVGLAKAYLSVNNRLFSPKVRGVIEFDRESAIKRLEKWMDENSST